MRVLMAIEAVERLDPTVPKGVDVNGAKLRHVADRGQRTSAIPACGNSTEVWQERPAVKAPVSGSPQLTRMCQTTAHIGLLARLDDELVSQNRRAVLPLDRNGQRPYAV